MTRTLTGLGLLFPLLTGALGMGCGSSSGGGGFSTAAAVASGTSSPVPSGTTSAPATGNTAPASTPTAPTAPTPPTTTTTTSPTTTPTTPSSVPPTAEPRYYNPHVRQVLYTYCTSCHSNTSNPAYTAYALNGFPTDDVSFANTVARGDLANPEGSLLLRKATGATTHGGGAVLKTTDPGYEYLVNWVRQGMVKDQFSTGPKLFVRHVQPVIDRQCYGCHVSNAGGYTVGTNVQVNYQELISVTDPNNPAQSLVLRKNDGSLGHPGGAGWRVGTPERDLILQWINDGRRYDQ